MGTMASRPNRWLEYLRLMRFNKPIGTLLHLWPMLWALWIAAEGVPRVDLLVIFFLGNFLMRSAGCVINDYADRDLDGHVARTRDRPLAAGTVTPREALILFFVLLALAASLLLFLNMLTFRIACAGAVLTIIYPFMKRYTYLPQVVLAAALALSVPMAFAATLDALPELAFVVYLATLLSAMVHDTIYAMVDRDDDIRIGIKSTAILFGESDRFFIGVFQVLLLITLIIMGVKAE
ncbi:MAG: UbiA family prenyltransferase, partial [Gammaproteobacteria bacterium]|nr:UbiA family prenyltransferase [Gammaproteobacteria bacterium]